MNSSELKKEAISRVKGKFGKLVLIQFMYVLLTLACALVLAKVSQISNELTVVASIAYLIFMIITLPFSFGVLSSFIKISKDEKVSITDFINIGLKKFSSYWKVVLRIFLKIIIPLILFFIIAVFATAFILSKLPVGTDFASSLLLLCLGIYSILTIFMIYLILPYSLSMFVLYDNPDKTSKEILETSFYLMKDNKWKYVKLLLSFFGWFLLVGIITYFSTLYLPENIQLLIEYIPTLFLIPYISISQLSFYEELKASKAATMAVVESVEEKEEEN